MKIVPTGLRVDHENFEQMAKVLKYTEFFEQLRSKQTTLSSVAIDCRRIVVAFRTVTVPPSPRRAKIRLLIHGLFT